MDKLQQSIDIFDALAMNSVGISGIVMSLDSLWVNIDTMRILELRSDCELFDQKFGKFILDYVENSSLESDKADINQLIKARAAKDPVSGLDYNAKRHLHTTQPTVIGGDG